MLVVDDESIVRLLVRRMLEPDVCAVVEAADGESALRLLEHGEPPIDVVLTDLVMPGIDGFDIVQVLARHRPGLPVVCMSGFAAAKGTELTAPFVLKPFSLETLRAAVEPLLARGEGHRSIRGTHDGAVDLVAAAHGLRRLRASPTAPS